MTAIARQGMRCLLDALLSAAFFGGILLAFILALFAILSLIA